MCAAQRVYPTHGATGARGAGGPCCSSPLPRPRPLPDLLTNVSVAARDPISPAWHVLASEPADEAEPLSARVLEARRAARRGPASGAREVGEEEDFGLAMDDSGGPILRRAADLMFDGDGDDRHAPPAPTRRRLLKGSRPRSRLFRERYLLCAAATRPISPPRRHGLTHRRPPRTQRLSRPHLLPGPASLPHAMGAPRPPRRPAPRAHPGLHARAGHWPPHAPVWLPPR